MSHKRRRRHSKRMKSSNEKPIISRQKAKKQATCLLIEITHSRDTGEEKDNFTLDDAHDIIIKAQQKRGYIAHSLKFEPKDIKSALKNNGKKLHQIMIKELDINIDNNINSYFDKLIFLGHCNYYTINHTDSYYNSPFLSHEPTPIKHRSICGLNIYQMSQVIKYFIKQLSIYNISLCCCESATKNVHLEYESLDELTEDEEYIYNAVTKYRLSGNIRVKPKFVLKSDEADKHLFVAFNYSSKYAKLNYNLVTQKKMESIQDQTLSVLDLISIELYEQNVLDSLGKTLIINALNGFGYYRHPEMNEKEIHHLKNKLMNKRRNKDDDEKGTVYHLDEKFVSGPLRDDCIYYSIKNRDGVQWLIDKDYKKLYKNKGWCQYELTQILDVDSIIDKNNEKGDDYKEEYFVKRPHVIQYQFDSFT